jgi:hypothetical protein
LTTRLPGPPISNDTALVTLLEHNVLVGIGTTDAALAAHTRFDLAWVTFQGSLVIFNWILTHIVLYSGNGRIEWTSIP